MLRFGMGCFAAGGCSKGFEYVQHDAMTISQLRSLFQQQTQVRFFNLSLLTFCDVMHCKQRRLNSPYDSICSLCFPPAGDRVCGWLRHGLQQVHRNSLELLARRPWRTTAVLLSLSARLGHCARHVHVPTGKADRLCASEASC
jgi:hypothetical protein